MSATQEQLSKLTDDGFCVIENFVSAEEVEAMKQECFFLVDNMNPADHHTVFSTETQSYRDDYFLNSSDNISYFFEEKALDKDGTLLVDKHRSLNKIGHALHQLCPSFKAVTFSNSMKEVAKCCGYDDPVVCQSMYIFKQPRIGGAVVPHQDGTFLYADPLKVMGVWIALEDVTLENGCLWFIPGSHKNGLCGNYRMVRSHDETGPTTTFTGELVMHPENQFVPVPIKAGSMILIDGCVVHKSAANISENSRHIYTFHLYERSSKWSPENWLQCTKAGNFVRMADVEV